MACGAWLELGSVNESARAVCKRSALRARSTANLFAELGQREPRYRPQFGVDRARSALSVFADRPGELVYTSKLKPGAAGHKEERRLKSVSYTHLTLPTTPYV